MDRLFLIVDPSETRDLRRENAFSGEEVFLT